MAHEGKLLELSHLAYTYLTRPRKRETIKQQLKELIQWNLGDDIEQSHRREKADEVWERILEAVKDVPIRKKPELQPYGDKAGVFARLILLLLICRNLSTKQITREESKRRVKRTTTKKEKHVASIKASSRLGSVSGEMQSAIEMVEQDILRIQDVAKKFSNSGGFFSRRSRELLKTSLNCHQDLLTSMEQDRESSWEVYDTRGGWGPIPKEAFAFIVKRAKKDKRSPFARCKSIAAVLVTAGICPVSLAVATDDTEARFSYSVEKLARQICHTVDRTELVEVGRGRRYKYTARIIHKGSKEIDRTRIMT